MELRKQAIEAEEQQHYAARSSALIASLRATSNAKSSRLQESLTTVTDANIRRMRKAQINNLASDTERRIHELSERQVGAVEYQLVAGGKLNIVVETDDTVTLITEAPVLARGLAGRR